MKQVAEWLGHRDPAFTMRVYVDLIDEGVGEGLELPAPRAETRPGHAVVPSVVPSTSDHE